MLNHGRPEELGRFIRQRREALAPQAVGLPGGGRRRTAGLRREEVAQLSGMSLTWYTWIEQGRPVAASEAALSRLAAALKLSRAERDYLFELAGRRGAMQAQPDDRPAEAALSVVHSIGCPAYILDSRWDARACNGEAEALFVGWLDRPGRRNLLRFIFLEPAAATLISDWPARARRVTAEYRAATLHLRDDPAIAADVRELREASAEFRQLWEDQVVLAREGGRRSFRHPARGPLDYDQASFELSGHPDWKLTILQPAPA